MGQYPQQYGTRGRNQAAGYHHPSANHYTPYYYPSCHDHNLDWGMRWCWCLVIFCKFNPSYQETL